MLWIVLIGGLLVIWGVAYYKPDWFENVYETYVKDGWIMLVGVVTGIWQWMQTDPTWQQLIEPKYVPIALVSIAIIGIILRNINTKKK